MIVTCEGCETKYMLEDSRVPEGGIRVRCPRCKHVWRLMPEIKSDSVFEVTSSAFNEDPPEVDNTAAGWAAMEQDRRVVGAHTAEAAVRDEVNVALEESFTPQETPQGTGVPQEDPETKSKKERAKRLARVFVSDILIYNKDKRDKALKEGNLISVMGPEIKKAWEAYKEKVGPELVESTEYFRSALNEILADGQELF